MPDYDDIHFAPPAPTMRVMLRNPETGTVVPAVDLLLDSGADVTLLPQTAVDRLGDIEMAEKRFELAAFDGQRSFARGVTVDVLFERRAYRGLYLLTQDAIGVIGRDILNHFAVVLDGPALHWRFVEKSI